MSDPPTPPRRPFLLIAAAASAAIAAGAWSLSAWLFLSLYFAMLRDIDALAGDGLPEGHTFVTDDLQFTDVLWVVVSGGAGTGAFVLSVVLVVLAVAARRA